MIKRIVIITFVLTSLLVSSCSKYQKILKSNDRVLKYEKAIEYYAAEDWNRAKTIMEDILPVYKGTDKGEELLYKYSYCQYNMRDYILAGYYFRKFSSTFGNSEFVEEASFRSAECYYLDSPRSSLEQSSTHSALSELELFSIKYPSSKYVEDATVLRTELINKLAEKQYNNARHYLNLGYYKSAITALNSCLVKYPYSKFREDIFFDLLNSNYLLAKNSVKTKQKLRFEETKRAYLLYNDEFPTGNNAKEAKRISNISDKRIKESSNTDVL